MRVVAVKCDLCSFLPTGPECVRVCPTKTLFIIDSDSLERASAAKRAEAMDVFHPGSFDNEASASREERR